MAVESEAEEPEGNGSEGPLLTHGEPWDEDTDPAQPAVVISCLVCGTPTLLPLRAFKRFRSLQAHLRRQDWSLSSSVYREGQYEAFCRGPLCPEHGDGLGGPPRG